MKKFKFRLQVVLDMREHELEQRQMEAAKIVAILQEQQAKLEGIVNSQKRAAEEMNALYTNNTLDIQEIQNYHSFILKLEVDEKNQMRVINNTKSILEKKQEEVREAHKKAEVLRKLKEKQEKEYYKAFLASEIKEIDDITSARFNIK